MRQLRVSCQCWLSVACAPALIGTGSKMLGSQRTKGCCSGGTVIWCLRVGGCCSVQRIGDACESLAFKEDIEIYEQSFVRYVH